MEKSKAIIFTHHNDGELEYERADMFKKLNPDWDFIPVGFEGYNLLPGSIHARRHRYPNNSGLSCTTETVYENADWYSCDILIAEAASRWSKCYDEYFVVEYDTVANVSIDDFFDIADDDMFLCNKIDTKVDQDWEWIQRYLKFSNSIQQDFAAIGQSTCLYFKYEAIKYFYDQMTSNFFHRYDNMLSELRLGTIMSQNYEIKPIKTKTGIPIDAYITWDPNRLMTDFSQPFFYHPIK